MASSERRRAIFYLEDDAEGLEDHCSVLREKYDLSIGAHWGLIKQPREQPVDLVIIDLMIHHHSLDESGEEIENIQYPNVHWNRTGLEFLKRLRGGEHEALGFPADVPVIVASAVVNYPVRELVEEQFEAHYLEKPFTVEQLKAVVDKALGTQEEEGQ